MTRRFSDCNITALILFVVSVSFLVSSSMRRKQSQSVDSMQFYLIHDDRKNIVITREIKEKKRNGV